MLWFVRGFHTLEYIDKKTGTPPSGCLAFLAQSLTKLHHKPRPNFHEIPDDQFQDDSEDDDDHSLSISSPPVLLRESSDPQLRASVSHLLALSMRADPRTYASILRDCTEKKALLEGKQVHAHICKGGFHPDTLIANLLIHMYGSCGSVAEARSVFDSMKNRNVYSSNMIISAYARNGYLQEALTEFEKALKTNTVTWNTMVSAYARNGCLQQARSLFDRTPHPNVVSWNNIIAAYAHAGQHSQALTLFRFMDLEAVEPNRVTFLHALDACSSVAEGLAIHREFLDCGTPVDVAMATGLVIMYGRCGFPDAARFVFDRLLVRDVVLWTSLMVAYAQNGELESAKSVFGRAPCLNVVSWTAMVAGHAQNGHTASALRYFKLMDLEGVPANRITFISALDACASSSCLQTGRVIDAEISESELQSFLPVVNALVNMYGKCRELGLAVEKFTEMPRRNTVSWSVMIAGYAQNGQGLKGFELFQLMQLEGVRVNEIALCSVLSAAVHANKLLEGVLYFLTVPEDYGFRRHTDHYSFVGEILTRSGLLEKAEKLASLSENNNVSSLLVAMPKA